MALPLMCIEHTPHLLLIFLPLITYVANIVFRLLIWSLMRKMSSQFPILVQSRGMPLLLSGILFRIAVWEEDQTYKFGQQDHCLLEAITLKK